MQSRRIILCAATWLVAAGGAGVVAAPTALPSVEPDAELEQRLLEIAGDGFRIHRTAHFAIAYDTPHDTVRLLQGRLEGTFAAVHRWCDRLGLIAAPLTSPMGVVLFARAESFEAACMRARINSSSVSGFYEQKLNLSFFLDATAGPIFAEVNARLESLQAQIDAARAAGGSSSATAGLVREANSLRVQRDAAVERFNRLIIQHEAAHQLLHNLGVHPRGVRLPDWLVEGLACHFESGQVASGKGKAAVNQTRLADFREACAVGADRAGRPVSADDATAAWDAAVGSGQFLPLATLCGGGRIAEQDGVGAYRYAQAWGLVFFLIREDEAKFAAYVKATSTRRPGPALSDADELALFVEHFGPADEAFAQRWLRSVLSQPVRAE
jgi:hypothetical protein